MEAIKILANLGKPPLGRLIHYRALDTSFREIQIKKDPNCPLCGAHPSITKPVSSNHPNHKMNQLQEISTLELRERLNSQLDGILLDVRERDEYLMNHIDQSQLIPLSGWPAAATHLPKDTKYYVHCAAGMRSARACQWMLQNGFTDVTNVSGGMKQWLEEEPS